VTDPARFDNGYFNDAHDIDLKTLTWAYKQQREVLRRMPVVRGELAVGHPQFPAGSAAASVPFASSPPWPSSCGSQMVRGGEEEQKERIVYAAEDDAAIERHIRENVSTTWHALGTAKMAPREEGGVVDARLDVYGVRGLKVADMSVARENVGANTNNTALMIGEKAADIIVGELGLADGSEQRRYSGGN